MIPFAHLLIAALQIVSSIQTSPPPSLFLSRLLRLLFAFDFLTAAERLKVSSTNTFKRRLFSTTALTTIYRSWSPNSTLPHK
jgi:hypothetical protein